MAGLFDGIATGSTRRKIVKDSGKAAQGPPPAAPRPPAPPPAPPAQAPRGRGRPSAYTPELRDKICMELATTKDGLEVIATRLGLNPATVWAWLLKQADFQESYTRARAFQSELGYDEMRAIANAPMTHNMNPIDHPTDPGVPLDGAAVLAEIARRKLVLDVIKFQLMKLQPKKYGMHTNTNIDVNVRREVNGEQFEELKRIAMNAGKALPPPSDDDGEYIDHEDINEEGYADKANTRDH